MVTLQETKMAIKADIKRRLILGEHQVNMLAALCILFKPGVMTVLLYRLSRFCFYHHLKVFCKLIGLIVQLVNTSEISPEADIGGGLVIADGGAVGIPGTAIIGENCTFMGLNTFTLGAMEDEPNPDDRIRVGNHCVFGVFTRVIRPVTLPDGTQVKPGSVVISSVKKTGQTLSGIPARRKAQQDYEHVQLWNPIKGSILTEKLK